MHLLKKITAWLLVAFGAFMILGGIGMVSDSVTQAEVIENLLVASLLGGLPTVLGVIWLRNMKNNSQKSIEKRTERAVLQLAERFEGQLTVLKVASNSQFSAEEAKEILENMYKKGLAELNVGQSGQIFYEFRDFLKDPSKGLHNPLH